MHLFCGSVGSEKSWFGLDVSNSIFCSYSLLNFESGKIEEKVSLTIIIEYIGSDKAIIYVAILEVGTRRKSGHVDKPEYSAFERARAPRHVLLKGTL